MSLDDKWIELMFKSGILQQKPKLLDLNTSTIKNVLSAVQFSLDTRRLEIPASWVGTSPALPAGCLASRSAIWKDGFLLKCLIIVPRLDSP